MASAEKVKRDNRSSAGAGQRMPKSRRAVAKDEPVSRAAGRKMDPASGELKDPNEKMSRGPGPDTKPRDDSVRGTQSPSGFLGKAVRKTLFSAGWLVSRVKHVNDVPKAVNLKSISEETKKVSDSMVQGGLEIGGKIKHAVPVEKIAAETKKILDSSVKRGRAVGDRIKRAVPVEKITKGTKKVLKATQQGVSHVGESVKDGVQQIGQSFVEGFRSVNEAGHAAETFETAAGTEEVKTSPKEELCRVSPKGPRKVISVKNESRKNTPFAERPEDELEKEVDAIVRRVTRI